MLQKEARGLKIILIVVTSASLKLYNWKLNYCKGNNIKGGGCSSCFLRPVWGAENYGEKTRARAAPDARTSRMPFLLWQLEVLWILKVVGNIALFMSCKNNNNFRNDPQNATKYPSWNLASPCPFYPVHLLSSHNPRPLIYKNLMRTRKVSKY